MNRASNRRTEIEAHGRLAVSCHIIMFFHPFLPAHAPFFPYLHPSPSPYNALPQQNRCFKGFLQLDFYKLVVLVFV